MDLSFRQTLTDYIQSSSASARSRAVSGREIVLEPRIVEADRPEGVRYLRDVDLLAVLELAPSFAQVPDLFEAYCRRAGPVALPDFLYALATAVARRWLVAE